ncbi:MAG TPA: hypothetical protein PLK77_04160 [Pyrinomonadaceae bacterium]|nr:hypothetical protein [Pyrinomonadaceae bacterium]
MTEYETRRSVKSPNRAVEILDRLASRKYIATNAFVVKAQVQEIESDNFLLEIINWSAFNPTAFVPESFRALYEESMRGGNAALISSANTLWRKDAFHLSLKANPSEARKIRNNLRVLFVGEIREPFVAASSQETKATVTKPTAFKNRHYYLKVNLSEIWVYDFTTGTVYERLKNTSAVSANSEELTVSRADVEAFRKSAKENQIEMEVAILIADLEQTIAKFAADDYKLVTVSNAKGLLDDATRLNKGLSELETRLSEGAVKENLKAATLMINIASALLIEAGGTRVLSDQVRSDILNSRDLAKMPVAERPKIVMAGASRLWAAFQKALAQVGQ